MSIERAVKFCDKCFNYSEPFKEKVGTDKAVAESVITSHQYFIGRSVLVGVRDDATKEAMLALEESLTKGPREPTAFENKPEGSIEQVRAALDACMNCDYNRPSIVDVFIKKSQDFPK